MIMFDLLAAAAISLVTAFSLGSLASELADRAGLDVDIAGWTTCAVTFGLVFWRLLNAMGVVL